MMQQTAQNSQPSRSPNLGRRITAMIRAWAILGAVVGIHTGWRLQGGLLATIAQTIAGIVVFSMVGLLLAAFTGRPNESLLGGAVGLLIGVVAVPLGSNMPAGETVNLCLTMGALVGATCRPWIRGVVRLGSVIHTLSGRLRSGI